MNIHDVLIEQDNRGQETVAQPEAEDAKEAVRTLLRWAGDDPDREGLCETPERVIRGYMEWFSGYGEDPVEILEQVFEDVGGYQGPVILKDIRFQSCCEHHLAPIVGMVHVGYLPDFHVVGISKIARVVDVYARRLQIQERMTSEIATALMRGLLPKGVIVVVEAEHFCMSKRGVHKPGVKTVTKSLHGVYVSDQELRQEFMLAIGRPSFGE